MPDNNVSDTASIERGVYIAHGLYLNNLPPYCTVVKKSGSLNFLDPSGPAWPVMGVLYLYLYLNI